MFALKGLNLCFNLMNVKLCLLNQEIERFSYLSIKSLVSNIGVGHHP